ncbi:very-long-chain (3R)-3-hydroxyacyl-CoA dehydratase 4 [Sphaeramia orbicularis]|uniref:Very-long-chain (3R)-3-hydroxyacyl-CoA dehydratase n=1 Tax=Sphaeramia orbicularis TaxID=375764 RepID=A0A673APA6_9TELE|nr:very-long-chain (3R)-3-hydroxyacyl-CoA dehydratase 4 [Sphaeramia orbicularis]
MLPAKSNGGRQQLLERGSKEEVHGMKLMFNCKHVYRFVYNMLQFCGHSWILTNIIARFITFGKDAMADTFHSVSLVMGLCQMFSILELFHIADRIEKARLLPRFIHVLEKNVLLVILVKLEDVQSKPVVSVLFFSWNLLDMLRYPYEVMCVMSKPSPLMLWSRYTLWIPLYVVTVVIEGFTIYEVMLYLGPEVPCPPLQDSAEFMDTRDSVDLMLYLSLLVLGATVSLWQLVKERRYQMDKWSNKLKKK